MIPSSLVAPAWRLYAAYRRWVGRDRVLLWPPFDDADALADIFNRLAHNYGPETEIAIPIAREGLRPAEKIPDYMPRYEQRFRARWVEVEGGTRDPRPELEALRRRATLYWKAPADARERERIRRIPNCAIVDPNECEEETAAIGWIEVMSRPRDARAERRRFVEWMRARPKRRRAYLLCTGPSLARFAEFDFSDGWTIGCNTVVANAPLMAHAPPDVMVAVDAIHHFGPSNYAARFRRDLEAAAARSPFLFCTVDTFGHVVERRMKLPPERVCLIPLRRGMKFERLDRQWGVAPTANVLTQLMLPIAHTLAEEIYIIGADGRDPNEREFWRHDPSSQLTDAMADLKACHPAFFAKRDYAAYYERHCEIVRLQVETIEARGGKVRSLTPSHIPALAERSA
jgi:hypothetical protein